MAPSTKTIDAMKEALEDEYLARATYQKVIETFGPVRPFVNIVEAEDRHAKALLALFAKYGIEPPQDTWPERVKVPTNLAEACRAGVEAEIENQAMYERLLKDIDEPEVLAVMQRLQQASQERHLPAFQRCLERESTGQSRQGEGPVRKRSRQRGR
ncbi:MAG: ferritin-like domain-containing protein [Pseudomonadota bacterium]